MPVDSEIGGATQGPSSKIGSLATATRWAEINNKGGRVAGLDVVLGNLAAYVNGLHSSVLAAADEIGHLLANYAKTNHPWTPRTGHTDQSTVGGLVEATTEFALVGLSAGMNYDIYLELARQGKWAWLWPAVIACQGDIERILAVRLRR